MENCRYYARFMSKLPRPVAEGLYWGFFTLLLLLLFTASWRFGRVTERIKELSPRDDRERERLLKHCFWFCFGCGTAALVVVFIETFVTMALQFCDGEPLIGLYWATWTMLQVGGLIAIWGICLHIRHMITGKKHPPWALALGTPVLVVAGLGHYFQGKLRRSRAARSIKERSRSRGRAWGRRDGRLSEAYVADPLRILSTWKSRILTYSTTGPLSGRTAPNQTAEGLVKILRRPRGICPAITTPRLSVIPRTETL